MFNRYSMNLSPKPKTLQDILAEKYKMQQEQGTTGVGPTAPGAIGTNNSRMVPESPFEAGEPNPLMEAFSSQQGEVASRPRIVPETLPGPLNPDFGSPATKSAFDAPDVSFGSYEPPDFAGTGIGPQTGDEQQDPREASILERFKTLKNPQMAELVALLKAGGPKREDYKPGAIDRIAAALVGASAGFDNPIAGYKAGREIMDRPYNEAYDSYQDKVKNMTALANLGEGEFQHQVKALDIEAEMLAQIAKDKLERDKLIQQGWTEIKDELNGTTIMYNKGTGEKRTLRTSLSAAEKSKEARDLQKQKDDAAMGRTQAGQAGANARNAATIAGQNQRAREANLLAQRRIKADKDDTRIQRNLQGLAALAINPNEFFTYDKDTKIWTMDEAWANKLGSNKTTEQERARILKILEAINPSSEKEGEQ